MYGHQLGTMCPILNVKRVLWVSVVHKRARSLHRQYRMLLPRKVRSGFDLQRHSGLSRQQAMRTEAAADAVRGVCGTPCRQALMPLITEMRILCMAARWSPRIFLFMSNRSRHVLYLLTAASWCLVAGGFEAIDSERLRRAVQYAAACGALVIGGPGAIAPQPTEADVELLLDLAKA
jgi:hypothetical protein